MCGLLGWENTRPLPACVYHFIRKTYPRQTQLVSSLQNSDRKNTVHYVELIHVSVEVTHIHKTNTYIKKCITPIKVQKKCLTDCLQQPYILKV